MSIVLKTTPERIARLQKIIDTSAVNPELEGLLIDHIADAKAAHELYALINNPHTDDFLPAVRLEAAHQQDRWGEAHDCGKSAENWFWLVGYLAGKCLRAVITGDHEKALHHTISTAAALANWYEAIRKDTSSAGVGQDNDIKPVELARFEGPDGSLETSESDARPYPLEAKS